MPIVSSLVFLVSEATAAPVLRRGDVQIAVTAPAACEVTMALSVDGGAEMDHRIEAAPETRVELIEVAGARQVGELRAIGRTQSLVLSPTAQEYRLRYRVRQPDALRDRCPLWLPVAPTDGRPDAVRLRVELPSSTTPANSFPAFTWNGTQGTASLGHLPAFVRLAYVAAGESAPWDITRTMDAMALVVFVAASALWLRFRRR